MTTTFIPRPQGYIEINAPGGLVNRGVAKAARKLRDDARRFAPVNTGALRQSIVVTPGLDTAAGCTYRVGSPLLYAGWQEHGVAGPIFPRRAKVLRFKPKGSGTFVFASHTSGVPAVHYLARAKALVRPGDFT